MKPTESVVPSKNRLDIVDTAVLRQKELWALKWLALLFMAVLIYEGWDFIPSPFSSPEIPVPEMNRDLRRSFPDKRINRLTQVLRGIQQSFPLIRDSLKPHLENLDWLKDQTPQTAGLAALNGRLETALEGLWRLFHSPMWEDPKPFGLAVLEIKTLYKLLRLSPPSEAEIPPLAIGPRPMAGLELAGRDLFQFAVSPEKPKGKGDGGKGK